ncbi:insulinase family protein [Candidatus Pacearchaeota archaeon]|nr:insulinase family protein [Candidatus Pacearchaeota archaeon]
MKFQKRILKNGITVMQESRDLPIVSLSIANKFGAAYETSYVKGIAHFIEHLVFTGTKTRTHEQISAEIEKRGGILNAFTTHDMTGFWFKLPSEHLFSGLDILTDMLNNPTFNQEKFEKEKRVILEEIKMYHDNPQKHVFEKIEENLYKKPFGEGVIGSEKTVSRFNREFVANYFKKVYNPSNYIVTIVGSADFEKICEYLEENFKPKKTSILMPKITKQISHTMEERPGIDQAHFVFGMHAPLATEKLCYALEVLDAYLANGMSSRLFLKIREEKGLAYNIKGSTSTEKNYSYYTIYIGTTKSALPEVKKIILEEFANVKNLTQKQLEESKERLIGLRKISSEESINVMSELTFAELVTKAEEYYEHEKKIKSVSIEDVKSLAQIKEYSTAAIVPK